MKPVDNELTFPWAVGDELAYVSEDDNEYQEGGIIITNIAICRNKNCPNSACIHVVFSDENDNEWCAILDDFEFVR